jgi:hypothetical protein
MAAATAVWLQGWQLTNDFNFSSQAFVVTN